MSDFEDKLNSILSSPEEMEKIMGIARSISGSLGVQSDGSQTEKRTSSPQPQHITSLSDLDPKMLKLVSHLIREYKSPENDKTALLTAMKPYLRPERQAAIDKASGIVKMAHLAKVAFSELSGGDEN